MQRKWIILFMILALVTLACGFFGNDKTKDETLPEAPQAPQVQHNPPSAPANEEEPVMEEQVPDEPAAEAPAMSGSDFPMYFLEEFDSEFNEDLWFTEVYYTTDEDEDEDFTPDYSIEQRRGVLRFEINDPYVYLYQIVEPNLYGDVRIDFEIENKGVNTNNVGAICRYTDYGWYEFVTTSGGYYSIIRYYEDGNKELATGGIKSIRFGVDKKNVYTMICQGKNLILIVNGEEIARVKDDEIPDDGYAGINVSTQDVVPVQVEINWIQISQPE